MIAVDDELPLRLAAGRRSRSADTETRCAAPNYITAFAPGWKYAPYDDADAGRSPIGDDP